MNKMVKKNCRFSQISCFSDYDCQLTCEDTKNLKNDVCFKGKCAFTKFDQDDLCDSRIGCKWGFYEVFRDNDKSVIIKTPIPFNSYLGNFHKNQTENKEKRFYVKPNRITFMKLKFNMVNKYLLNSAYNDAFTDVFYNENIEDSEMNQYQKVLIKGNLLTTDVFKNHTRLIPKNLVSFIPYWESN